MKVTVTTTNRNCGIHNTIVEEPYASALANIDGLCRAGDNATYRGVRFGRSLQRKLAYYFCPCNVPGSLAPHPDWQAVSDAGRGTMDIHDETLAKILAASAAIDAVIAKAVPAQATHPCAGKAGGCCCRVRKLGDYCRSCAHDELDN